MTNKERQHSLDKKKWIASESVGFDMSGAMDYCAVCESNERMTCVAPQDEREKNTLCATAYNRLIRAKAKMCLQRNGK